MIAARAVFPFDGKIARAVSISRRTLIAARLRVVHRSMSRMPSASPDKSTIKLSIGFRMDAFVFLLARRVMGTGQAGRAHDN
jgi:hypothetical protein